MKYEIKRLEYFSVFKLVITVCLALGIIFGIILGVLLGAGIGGFFQSYDILGRIGLTGGGAVIGVIMGVVSGIIWAILAARLPGCFICSGTCIQPLWWQHFVSFSMTV